MLSIQGLIAKDLKRQDKLPEKWNDIIMDPVLKDVGLCYVRRTSTVWNEDYVRPSDSTYAGIMYCVPYGTAPNSLGLDPRKSWEATTYVTILPGFDFSTYSYAYCALDIMYYNTRWSGLYSTALCKFGSGGKIPDKGPGLYGVRLTHDANASTLKGYYSYEGSDFIHCGTDSYVSLLVAVALRDT